MAEPSKILLQNLAEIEQIISMICRRKGMDADATEEFAAEVKLRLVEDNYAVIRKFEGRSPFAVYIGAVVKRLLLDYQRREWGKWRASAEARHFGPIAIELEHLLYRERRSMEDALLLLLSQHPNVTRSELERIAAQLPARTGRHKVDLENADAVAASPTGLDPIRSETAARISAVVKAAIRRLPEEDQLILQLRFESGMTVAQIARALHIPQPTLYRRLYKHFDGLRAELLHAGVQPADVEDLVGTDTSLLDFHWKNSRLRTSEEKKESTVAARREKTSS
jgi:RNA polymerase sigma factor (sigma-70 family)